VLQRCLHAVLHVLLQVQAPEEQSQRHGYWVKDLAGWLDVGDLGHDENDQDRRCGDHSEPRTAS
jgi:hypothetical protein